jgi:polyribonucleotide nucleotidyltransferase
VIRTPRRELAETAPRIITLQINPEKIGAVIGPGGKMIRSIIEESGAQIDVEDDGRVFITTSDAKGAEIAQSRVEALTREIKVGEVFTGKVVRIMPYGAFVNLTPGKDGMVHVSELAEGRVENVEDVLKIGDEVKVMVIDVEAGTGKVSLSRRAILTGETADQRKAAGAAPRRGGDRGGFGGGASGDRGGSRGSDRGFGGDRNGPRNGDRGARGGFGDRGGSRSNYSGDRGMGPRTGRGED